MLLIKLSGTANSLSHLRDKKNNAPFSSAISESTKNNQISGDGFGVPCGQVMEDTHMQPKCWVKRLVAVIHFKRTSLRQTFLFLAEDCQDAGIQK